MLTGGTHFLEEAPAGVLTCPRQHRGALVSVWSHMGKQEPDVPAVAARVSSAFTLPSFVSGFLLALFLLLFFLLSFSLSLSHSRARALCSCRPSCLPYYVQSRARCASLTARTFNFYASTSALDLLARLNSLVERFGDHLRPAVNSSRIETRDARQKISARARASTQVPLRI